MQACQLVFEAGDGPVAGSVSAETKNNCFSMLAKLMTQASPLLVQCSNEHFRRDGKGFAGRGFDELSAII
jgi:hypothetical protein